MRACGKRARCEVRGWKPRLPVSLITRRRALKARAYEKRGWEPRLPGSGLTRCKLRLPDSSFTRRRAIRSLLVGVLFVLYS